MDQHTEDQTFLQTADFDMAMEQLGVAFADLSDACCVTVEAMAVSLQTVAAIASEWISHNAPALTTVPPKWYHYAQHSKKARIRKKYRDRILRHITQ